MTAGYGVAHAEVSTPRTTTVHGVQLWVALPDHARRIPRASTHHVSTPSCLAAGATVRVLLGALAG